MLAAEARAVVVCSVAAGVEDFCSVASVGVEAGTAAFGEGAESAGECAGHLCGRSRRGGRKGR